MIRSKFIVGGDLVRDVVFIGGSLGEVSSTTCAIVHGLSLHILLLELFLHGKVRLALSLYALLLHVSDHSSVHCL